MNIIRVGGLLVSVALLATAGCQIPPGYAPCANGACGSAPYGGSYPATYPPASYPPSAYPAGGYPAGGYPAGTYAPNTYAPAQNFQQVPAPTGFAPAGSSSR